MITANGAPVLAGTITMPLTGAWTATVETSGSAALAGSVVLADDDGAELRGAVVRSAVEADRVTTAIVGGAGGLGVTVDAAAYYRVTAAGVITPILAAAGESADAGTDSALLARSLSHWVRVQGTAGAALTAIVDALGGHWRVTPAGTIWAGTETWPVLAVTAQELEHDGAAGSRTVAPAGLTIRPGVTLGGERVSAVEYRVGKAGLRATYWVETDDDAGGLLGRMSEPLARFIRWVMRGATYHGLFPAVVQGQHADGTVDVIVDDEQLRGRGLSRVPVLPGVPGAKAVMAVGDRVLVGFRAGKPGQPYVSLWEQAAATRGVARVGDTVTVYFPLTIPIAGTMTPGGAFTAVATITTPALGMVNSGSSKVLLS